jgi:hypothetical protein
LKKILCVLTVVLSGCLANLPTATRPGAGVVQDIKRSPGDSPGRVAQTGGAYPTGYYVWVRMEDGTVQTLTQISGALQKGDRVRVTPEGRIEKIPD